MEQWQEIIVMFVAVKVRRSKFVNLYGKKEALVNGNPSFTAEAAKKTMEH